jgi:hypothetical protein
MKFLFPLVLLVIATSLEASGDAIKLGTPSFTPCVGGRITIEGNHEPKICLVTYRFKPYLPPIKAPHIGLMLDAGP